MDSAALVPYFSEDKELAEHYLREAEMMWDMEMGQSRALPCKTGGNAKMTGGRRDGGTISGRGTGASKRSGM